MRIELSDDTRKYKIFFEVVDTDGVVDKAYSIPSAAISDIFKQIAIANADGYVDMLSNVKPLKVEDIDMADYR